MPVINGWTVYAHPLLLDQLEKLTAAVEALKRKDPQGYRDHANAKLLAALLLLMFAKIPSDPTSSAYVQGKTLGLIVGTGFARSSGQGASAYSSATAADQERSFLPG